MNIGLWDEEDNFFYDVAHYQDPHNTPIRLRSWAGIVPLLACCSVDLKLCPLVKTFLLRCDKGFSPFVSRIFFFFLSFVGFARFLSYARFMISAKFLLLDGIVLCYYWTVKQKQLNYYRLLLVDSCPFLLLSVSYFKSLINVCW